MLRFFAIILPWKFILNIIITKAAKCIKFGLSQLFDDSESHNGKSFPACGFSFRRGREGLTHHRGTQVASLITARNHKFRCNSYMNWSTRFVIANDLFFKYFINWQCGFVWAEPLETSLRCRCLDFMYESLNIFLHSFWCILKAPCACTSEVSASLLSSRYPLRSSSCSPRAPSSGLFFVPPQDSLSPYS